MANLERLIVRPLQVRDKNQKGDFEAIVDEKTSTLFVREDVYKVIGCFNLSHDATLFYNVVICFPTWFSNSLGWSLEDISKATKILKQTLSGYIDENILDPEDKNLKGYGAMPPCSKKE